MNENTEMLSFLESVGLPTDVYKDIVREIETAREDSIRKGLPVFPQSAISGMAFLRLEKELSQA